MYYRSGNCASHTQLVSVSDNTAPQLDNVPADVNVSCLDVPAPAPVCAFDNCPNVSLSFDQQRIDYPQCRPDKVIYTLVRTWTATDLCGLSVSASQRVNVLDNIPPTIEQRADMSMPCTNVTVPPAPFANDSCTAVTVTPFQSRVPGRCDGEYQIRYSWRAMDACGNIAWSNFTVSVFDNTPPQVQSPPNATYECAMGELPIIPGADDCSGVTVQPPIRTNMSDICINNFDHRVDWIITDGCGNQAVASHYMRIVDVTPPVFDRRPANITVECAPPAPENLTASDNWYADTRC